MSVVFLIGINPLIIITIRGLEILRTGDEAGMASHISQIPVFKGTTTESWTSYSERVDFFFKGNGINDNAKKHTLLVSSFNPSTFQLVKSLIQPDALKMKTYAELVALLKDYYNPKPSVRISRYRFNSTV